MAAFNTLHLEDEAALRDSIRDILNIMVPEASVQQFGNCDDALRYVTNGKPEVHLFLLDVRVPGRFNGVGFAHKLRQLGYTNSIVFCSAYTRPSMLGDLNYSWLSKPMNLDDLLKIAKRAQMQV